MEIVDKAFHLLCSTFPVTWIAGSRPRSRSAGKGAGCPSSHGPPPELGRAFAHVDGLRCRRAAPNVLGDTRPRPPAPGLPLTGVPFVLQVLRL